MTMGDQQERLLSLDWAAGLIQGEAHFGFLIWQRRKDSMVFFPVFQISMKDEWAINRLKDVLAENGISVTIPRAPSLQKVGMHRIAIRGHGRLTRLLEVMMPRLGGDKKKSAQFVYDFLKSRTGKPKASPYSPSEVALVIASREFNQPRTASHKDPLRALKNPKRGPKPRVRSSETNTLGAA
jgi:hypothetical protein